MFPRFFIDQYRNGAFLDHGEDDLPGFEVDTSPGFWCVRTYTEPVPTMFGTIVAGTEVVWGFIADKREGVLQVESTEAIVIEFNTAMNPVRVRRGDAVFENVEQALASIDLSEWM